MSNIVSAVVVAMSPAGASGGLSNIVSAESVGGAGGPTKFGSPGAGEPIRSVATGGGCGLSNIESESVEGKAVAPAALSKLMAAFVIGVAPLGLASTGATWVESGRLPGSEDILRMTPSGPTRVGGGVSSSGEIAF